MAVNINELPADVKRKITKKAGIQREQILKGCCFRDQGVYGVGRVAGRAAQGAGTGS